MKKLILFLFLSIIIISPVKADILLNFDTLPLTEENLEDIEYLSNYWLSEFYEKQGHEIFYITYDFSSRDYYLLTGSLANNLSFTWQLEQNGFYLRPNFTYFAYLYREGNLSYLGYDPIESVGFYIGENYPYLFSYTLVYSNFDIIYPESTTYLLSLNNKQYELSKGKKLPTAYNFYKNSLPYDDNLITVNLDDYNSVVLSLKDYKQTKAFKSDFFFKGSIGVTPVYGYGENPKDYVTNNKIESRCNSFYKDFTPYSVYVLDSDLKNNAVYYFKACDKNSSFKFDSSIFNITYVTDDIVDDVVVTIDGTDYHVIPFDKLPSSANKNEEENYIPGETSSNIMDSTIDSISSFWNTLTTFMGLVTKFFNTLPIEFRAVCITSFTTACTLGIIKILKA